MIVNQLSANSLATNQLDSTQRSYASSDGQRGESSNSVIGNVRIETKQNSQEAADQIQSLQVKQPIGDVEQVKQNEKNLTQLMDELNIQLEKVNSSLRFERDNESEKMVIKIKNPETGEVIRQIPSQEFLAISNNITQFLEMQQLPEKGAMPTGLFTNETA